MTWRAFLSETTRRCDCVGASAPLGVPGLAPGARQRLADLVEVLAAGLVDARQRGADRLLRGDLSETSKRPTTSAERRITT